MGIDLQPAKGWVKIAAQTNHQTSVMASEHSVASTDTPWSAQPTAGVARSESPKTV